MSKKILVVDDEEDVIRIISSNLEAAGYQTIAANNGHEALERAATEKPDLILLDVTMPGMDGLEALRKLKETVVPDTAVVLLTAKSEKSDMKAGWDSGADLYLLKPFLPAELTQFVKCILEDGPALLQG
ncbi:MAG: response regulator [Abitibacteriaceae bacterium]|nr:response regulator [Abditibacteriaceae bacterium]